MSVKDKQKISEFKVKTQTPTLRWRETLRATTQPTNRKVMSNLISKNVKDLKDARKTLKETSISWSHFFRMKLPSHRGYLQCSLPTIVQ